MRAQPPAIDPDRMQAWVRFLHAHAAVVRRLANDLEAANKIPLGTYDVLVQLSEAGGALRHRDLLGRLLVLSQPGLSRRIDRLEEAGLVERRPDPRDGRGVIVRLSRSGRAALRSAAAVHLAGVEDYFGAALTDEEAGVLAAAFGRILDGLQDRPSRVPTARRR
ncbi:MarR family winged helix-turn-helix transcriptional regulator [Nakamurella endophytica]|uniref:MarR family winged helix-turn-helix transcriptional regulator n=1 Tax=Nakamurella endophytica TaxID=1748367 RepID=UPI00166DBECE|nr:MarR family transcriptional regulator [Nakamurella endophytica]